MQDIEDLQGKLQRTGDVIKSSDDNLDPDVLRRIEKEIKSIGDFIRSHYYEESHGGSSYRSANDAGKVLQLQMEKEELEMKLGMAKEAMNDYVTRLSDKVRYFWLCFAVALFGHFFCSFFCHFFSLHYFVDSFFCLSIYLFVCFLGVAILSKKAERFTALYGPLLYIKDLSYRVGTSQG